MSLPARQQRVLDGIEAELQESEPDMTARFAVFTRLTDGDGAPPLERLSGFRPRVTASLGAVVLIPVVFAMLITGVLLGGPRVSNCGERLTGYALTGVGSTVHGGTRCGRLARSSRPASPHAPPRPRGLAEVVSPPAPAPRLISPAG